MPSVTKKLSWMMSLRLAPRTNVRANDGAVERSAAIGSAKSRGAAKTLNRFVPLLCGQRTIIEASNLQKKALATHHNIAHLGRRDFVCPHEHCKRAFGYKHLLQRHLTKLHAPSGSESGSDNEGEHTETEPESPHMSTMDIDLITGKAYATRAKDAVKQASKLQCPYPELPPLLSTDSSEATSTSSKRVHACQYVFSRAYDLRRHLQAEHGVEVDREKVDEWVRGEKDARTTVQ